MSKAIRALAATALVSLLALSVLSYKANAGGLSRRSGEIGTSSQISAENPWGGQIVFIVDDTRDWLYDNMIDSLRVVNSDSGLVGTPWEIHFNVGINTGIGSDSNDNGIAGFRGQAASTGCGGYDCRMTLEQIGGVYSSGLVEICGHGGRHLAFDEYSAQSEWSHAYGPSDTTAMEWGASDPYVVMRDSLGITLHSFVTPFHRISDAGLEALGHYYRNIRVGGVWYPTGDAAADTAIFPKDNLTWADSTGVTINWRRGNVFQLNKQNQDPIAYTWSGHDKRSRQMWGPWYNGPRNMVPHMSEVTASGNSADSVSKNLTNIKWCIDFIAENKMFGVFTWHDQERSNPQIAPDLYDVSVNGSVLYTDTGELGMVGVMQLLRYMAHLCRNGALGRDGPKLRVMKFDDAMNSRNGLSYIAGTVETIDNPFLRPPAATPQNANMKVPYGFPYFMGYDSTGTAGDLVWADSLWFYKTPDEVLAPGGWVGYDTNDSPDATASDSSYTTGIWSSVIDGTASQKNFRTLILVVPVIPNSRARFSVYAMTSDANNGAAPHDSLGPCYLAIGIQPFDFNQDPTDTTIAWLQQSAATATETGPMRPLPSSGYPWGSTYQIPIADWLGGAAASDASPYAWERHISRFHQRDGSVHLKSKGWSSTFYTGSSLAGTQDRGYRWRQAANEVDIPPFTTLAKVAITPIGWNVSSACSLSITKPSMVCTPRGGG